jgi:prophage antirepressor-like protein
MSLIPFDYENHRVRMVVDDNGSTWFVAKDVAQAIGLRWNGALAIKHVPEHWRGVRSVLTPSASQDMAVLSEQGLYFFLNRSDSEKALPFQMKVNGEILPAIRKTGSYGQPSLTEERVAQMIEQAVTRSAVAIAKAAEFGPAAVDTQLITVAELVDRLNLPAGISRRSVSQQLNRKLIELTMRDTLRYQKSRGVWMFSAKTCGDEAQRLRPELIARARRDKRQTELQLVVAK